MNGKYLSRFGGLSIDKVIDRNYDEFHSEDETKEFAEKIEEVFETGKSLHHEHRSRRDDKYFLRTVSPVNDSEGRVTAVTVVSKDISERKRAEEALRESEIRFQQVAENAQEWIWEVDAHGLYIYASPIVEKILGYKPEEVVGKKHFYDLFHPEGQEELKKTVFELFAQKQHFYEFVNRNVRKDGETVWLSTSGIPILGKEGNLLGYRGADTDITERKRAEEELRQSEEKYRSLVESTEDSVYLVDRDCRYLFVNEKHLSRLGLPVDKIIGKTYGELHSEDETEEFAEVVEEVFETGKPVQHEHRSRRDGRYILRTLSPVKDPEGRVTAVTVVSKDITERKRAEGEREQLLKELEAKNRELERFTYTVSHDLRSPLVTIQGFTDMVQTDLAQNEVEKAKDNLKFIDNAAAKMDKLLSDTLELSRIGRIVNPPEDVLFGEIVEDALEQTAAQMKTSGVEVSIAEDFPTVHVDRLRITEVLVNLITNSINYRGEQSHPKIEIGHRIDNGERVFFVRDNGIGIDPGQHEKVFELFYRVDANGEGTGAGLAIAKRIVEVHNGRIWIESEKGKGCTVCFTLPVT